MVAPGGSGDGEVDPVESETESLERILESLSASPAKEVKLDVSSAADQDEPENSVEAAEESDSTDDDGDGDGDDDDDDDFQTFLRNHS